MYLLGLFFVYNLPLYVCIAILNFLPYIMLRKVNVMRSKTRWLERCLDICIILHNNKNNHHTHIIIRNKCPQRVIIFIRNMCKDGKVDKKKQIKENMSLRCLSFFLCPWCCLNRIDKIQKRTSMPVRGESLF